MKDKDDFMDIEVSEDDITDWVTFNDIYTGKPIRIKKDRIEAYEEAILDPDAQYKGPYKKGKEIIKIYTNNNFYEVAATFEEVEKIL